MKRDAINTARHPLIDQLGNHWAPHGEVVSHHQHGDPTARPGHGIDVYSYFSGQGSNSSHAPFVLLVHTDSKTTAYTHLLPADARRFADALVAAADMADAVLRLQQRPATGVTS